jgi:nucleoside-diphosphate-sugar epimerase
MSILRAFVTGGSGFVGRNLIETLTAHGCQVRALARTDTAADTVRRLGAEVVSGDLSNVDAMRRGMADCQVVFHSAAHLGDWGNYEEFYRGNVTGTENVLKAALLARVPKFVHVGTEAVLVGGAPIVNVDETRPVPEEPIGLYPLTKAMAEQRVVAANSPELTTVIVRPRLIWGKGDTTLLPRFIEAMQQGKFMWINGGRYQTSTCHVANVCEGMILAAEHGRGGEVYYLTDGPPIEMRAFLTAMVRSQGVEPGNRSIPRSIALMMASLMEMIWQTFKLKGSPPVTITAIKLIGEEVTVNDDKARREIGYRSLVSREEGLAMMKIGNSPATSDRHKVMSSGR